MAQRRMFSPQIVESDEFLGMPVSSQALYFHLGMNADDDGFIQPRIIMRTVGAAEDDLKVLLAKRFLLAFETGVVVIKHWLIHNLIQKDRYHETRFLEEKKSLLVKDNKAYTDNPDSVNKMLPQVRLGKVSTTESDDSDGELVMIDEDGYELGKKPKNKNTPEMLAVYKIFSDNPLHVKWKMVPAQREAATELLKTLTVEDIRHNYILAQKHRNDQFCPKIYSPYDMVQKMKAMENYFENL